MNLRSRFNAQPFSPARFAAMTLVVTAVSLAGCSSSSSPDSPGGGSGGDAGSVAGTWKASALTVSYGSPGTTPTVIMTAQTVVLTQSGDNITFTFANDDDTDGMCSGTISGSTITSMCSLTELAGDTSCTASFSRTDTIDDSASPRTMATSYSYTAGGGSACGYSGNVFMLSGTLTFGS